MIGRFIGSIAAATAATLLIGCADSLLSESEARGSLFPLHVGNSWTYEADNGERFTMRIEEEIVIRGAEWYRSNLTRPLRVEQVDSMLLPVISYACFRIDHEGVQRTWAPLTHPDSAERPVLLLPGGQHRGRTFDVEAEGFHFPKVPCDIFHGDFTRVALESTGTPMTMRDTTYSCHVYRYSPVAPPRFPLLYEADFYAAPGIGIVRMTSTMWERFIDTVRTDWQLVESNLHKP